ncbi:MAG: YdcF family protein [bacterium]
MTEQQNPNKPLIVNDATVDEEKSQAPATPKTFDAIRGELLEKRNAIDLEAVQAESTQDKLKSLLPDFQAQLGAEAEPIAGSQGRATPKATPVEYRRKFDFGKVTFSRSLKGFFKLIFLRLIPLCGILWLLAAGTAYVLAPTDEAVSNADAIIVVPGTTLASVEKGLALYKENKAMFIMVVGLNDKNPLKASITDLVNKQGIPSEKLILETTSAEPHENAIYAEKIAETRKFTSIILVAPSYHQRYAYLSFNGAFRLHQDFSITNDPAPETFWDWKLWWANGEGRAVTFAEVMSIVDGWRMGYF